MLLVVLKIAMAFFVPFLKHNRFQELFYSHCFVSRDRVQTYDNALDDGADFVL